jgi:hypothetical protein
MFGTRGMLDSVEEGENDVLDTVTNRGVTYGPWLQWAAYDQDGETAKQIES